jgi:hypothetical protein
MALIATQVSLLVGANGFGFWHYRTPDAKAAIHAANYFNGVASMLNVGDFLCINASDGNEITSVVSISLAGVVVIGAGTAVALAEEMAAAKKEEEAAAKKAAGPTGPTGATGPAEHDPTEPEHKRAGHEPDKPHGNTRR